MNFVNKAMGDINVSKIFQIRVAIDFLSFSLQDHENIPVTTYELHATVGIKFLTINQSLVN